MSAGDLKKFARFVEFTEEDRTALDALLEPQTITAGRTLFCEGNEADALILLKSGRVRLLTGASGEMGLMCEGTWLGAISLMTIGRREATVRAEDDCEILTRSRPAFRRLVEDAPTTAGRLAEAVVYDLSVALRPQLGLVQREHSSDDIAVSG